MVLKNCVKISYKGITHQIVCDERFQYEDLLKAVMDKFNIEASLELAIGFYDERGHKFDKGTFEYLLLLFPQPQKIFFIRLDSAKILSNAENKLTMMYSSKAESRQSATVAAETYCEAVPVRRQNCFLGEMPGLTTTQASLSSNRIHPLDCSSKVMDSRRESLTKSPPKTKHSINPSSLNRSFRI